MNEKQVLDKDLKEEGSNIDVDQSIKEEVQSSSTEVNESIEEDKDEDEDEGGYEEEYIRIATKEGVEYLLNSPLPPAKGFAFGEDGSPLVWNPLKLRMERYSPEEVTIKKISLFHLSGAEDVFRIFCLANNGGEYKEAGLTVIRTVPISEISSWDTIVNEDILIAAEDIVE